MLAHTGVTCILSAPNAGIKEITLAWDHTDIGIILQRVADISYQHHFITLCKGLIGDRNRYLHICTTKG